jgi:hypothetical protein
MLLDPDGWVYMVLCPELKRLPSDEQRQQVVTATKTSIMKSKWFGLQLLGFVILSMAGFKVMGWATTPGAAHFALYTLGVVVAYIVIFSWIYGRKLRDIVRTELNQQGIPICISCGYDISGQQVSRCPECGREFK